MDQLSAISSQQSVVKEQTPDNRIQSTDNKKHSTEILNSKDDYKKVAKEMESLFAYQLLKIMRETTDAISTDNKSTDYNTYMSLFDMEVSRLFAERGLGLQDAIINWLERAPGINKEDSGV